MQIEFNLNGNSAYIWFNFLFLPKRENGGMSFVHVIIIQKAKKGNQRKRNDL